MRMFNRLPTLALMVFLCAGPSVALAESAIPEMPSATTGKAYDRESGELIYTEQHAFQYEGGNLSTHTVNYVGADGSLWASKSLDYSANAFAPDFRLDDQRDGYVEGGELTDERYRLYRVKDGEDGEKVVEMTEDTVVDAGFDTFVRTNLEALLADEVEKIRLAIPSNLIRLKFRVKKIGEEELFGLRAVQFKVEPASLLRLLADAIYITYDVASGRLLRYEGLTNIRNAKGQRYDARIDFKPEGYVESPGTP